MKEVASEILGTADQPGLHQPGTQTLVVLNTVDRAKAVYEALKKKKAAPKLLLVHSRFRPAEREILNTALQAKGEAAKDRVIIATQVVEAGVDISSHTLITELAPWASIVQRIGRCNRTGDDGPGRVFWIDSDEKLPSPYEKIDLDFARRLLLKLAGKSVSPRDLDVFKREENIVLPFEHKHVLRRRDLSDLFDTAPDLSGNDIDIARFVRSDDPDTDVQVFWRVVSDAGPSDDEPAPQRLELCSVPVGQIRPFLDNLAKKRTSGYVWDHLEDEWRKVDSKQIRPGLTILLPHSVGGYSELGWDSESKAAVTPLPPVIKVREESAEGEPGSASTLALTIVEHTTNVCRHMGEVLKQLGDIVGDYGDNLRNAALWHDVGKAHNSFQAAMRQANPKLKADQLWAKSGVKTGLRYDRRYFRHELASALALLQQRTDWPFVVAYMVATHHGKVRLSIRALPKEGPPPNPETLFALGVRSGDELPEVRVNGVTSSKTTLDLSPMQLGGDRSWTASALNLLGDLGPFKLAFLETLLRAADARASKEENHA
jgi:CRISPR-associated endonuclease/helicase Cas3